MRRILYTFFALILILSALQYSYIQADRAKLVNLSATPKVAAIRTRQIPTRVVMPTWRLLPSPTKIPSYPSPTSSL